ncbi:MAG: NAD(P)-dependent oxidoreductase [Planctomycetales bacterium]
MFYYTLCRSAFHSIRFGIPRFARTHGADGGGKFGRGVSVVVTDREGVLRTLREIRPRAVINTAVDQAETDAERCREVNAQATRLLSDACRELNIPLAQISTDYVFGDARDPVPRRETDPTSPQGVYAKSKEEAERIVREGGLHLIARTCGLYGLLDSGAPGPNFVTAMLRLAETRQTLRVVDDQVCSPTHVPHLARSVLFLLEKIIKEPKLAGTYHVVNQGETTWRGFAAEIFEQAGKQVELIPITTEEYGAAAPRPRWSVLDCSKYLALGGPPLPSRQDALAEYFASLNQLS